jgi:hypothetical protein
MRTLQAPMLFSRGKSFKLKVFSVAGHPIVTRACGLQLSRHLTQVHVLTLQAQNVQVRTRCGPSLSIDQRKRRVAKA